MGREGSPQFLAEVQNSGVLCGGLKPMGFLVIYSHIIMGDMAVAWISNSLSHSVSLKAKIPAP